MERCLYFIRRALSASENNRLQSSDKTKTSGSGNYFHSLPVLLQNSTRHLVATKTAVNSIPHSCDRLACWMIDRKEWCNDVGLDYMVCPDRDNYRKQACNCQRIHLNHHHLVSLPVYKHVQYSIYPEAQEMVSRRSTANRLSLKTEASSRTQ